MNLIEFGDCREIMRSWAADGIRVQTCVTSPPYWGLRDYGVDGQIGLERSLNDYISHIVDVFRCVWDVLRDDGTVWLNLGDTYAGGHCGWGGKKFDACHLPKTVPQGVKPKNLIGVPWRVALALQADGWYLRQDIIWHKPNSMPESVLDRCTKSHEYLFLLTKKPRYYYDSEAIKEESKYPTDNRKARQKKADYYDMMGENGQKRSVINPANAKTYPTKNKRSVWSITTRPFKGAHFAVFPPALVEPCILAGTSERGACPKCGAPWVRDVERKRMKRRNLDAGDPRRRPANYSGASTTKTTGWSPVCKCDGGDPIPCVVLDPFMGSGTTAMVAIQNHRSYLGCELNPDYKGIQEDRINNVQTKIF